MARVTLPSLAIPLGVASVVLGSAGRVLACAVCFGGEGNDWTGGFLLGTIVMLALPPLIVISAGVAIYRAMKRQELRLRERDAQQQLRTGAH